jgi:hypothetical protein
LVELARKLGVTPQYLAWGSREVETADRPGVGDVSSPVEFALDVYERAARRARTKEERLWALAGLGHIAAIQGDVDLALAALARVDPALVGKAQRNGSSD